MLKKLWNMKMMVISVAVGIMKMILQSPEKKTEKTGDQGKNKDYPEHNTVKIS